MCTTQSDSALCTLLGSAVCHTSEKLQHGGKTISKGDVILGNYPGVVINAVGSASSFWVRMKTLKPEKNMEFYSRWSLTEKESIVDVCMAGRTPAAWLEETPGTFLGIHRGKKLYVATSNSSCFFLLRPSGQA